jgi:hypothetical protein
MSKTDPFVLAREANKTPFKTTIGDVTLSMPHIDDVDQFELGELYDADKKSDLAWLVGFFSLVMGEDVKALRDLKLKRTELLALYKAYLAHNGTDEGESSASSG